MFANALSSLRKLFPFGNNAHDRRRPWGMMGESPEELAGHSAFPGELPPNDRDDATVRLLDEEPYPEDPGPDELFRDDDPGTNAFLGRVKQRIKHPEEYQSPPTPDSPFKSPTLRKSSRSDASIARKKKKKKRRKRQARQIKSRRS